MSAEAKRQYVQAIYMRYRYAGRGEKCRILDEFCQVAGYHRKYAIRLLNGPAPGALRPPRRRGVTYAAGTIDALRAIWAAAGYPWSVHLQALLPLWLPWARRRFRPPAPVSASCSPSARGKWTAAWPPPNGSSSSGSMAERNPARS